MDGWGKGSFHVIFRPQFFIKTNGIVSPVVRKVRFGTVVVLEFESTSFTYSIRNKEAVWTGRNMTY